METLDTKIISEREIDTAAEIIRQGGLVIFPTETVYGLGANALDSTASAKIYAAKGRPSDNPLIIHLARPEDSEKYCHTSEIYYKIAELFMPGPVTFILPKKDIIPSCVTGGLDTVAVRVPSNAVANKLISYAGVPIAAPSANLSGRPSTTTADHCIADLFGKIEAIIDGGECEIGLESTILTEKDGQLKLLRPGGVTVEMLEKAGFEVSIDKAVLSKLENNERPLAPGMKYRHYAPNAQVTLLDGKDEKIVSFMKNALSDENTVVLCFEEDGIINDRSVIIGSKEDSSMQAHRLFALLRDLDEHPNIKRVYAKLPSTDGIGLAIFNRLLKASGYNILKID